MSNHRLTSKVEISHRKKIYKKGLVLTRLIYNYDEEKTVLLVYLYVLYLNVCKKRIETLSIHYKSFIILKAKLLDRSKMHKLLYKYDLLKIQQRECIIFIFIKVF
ncbi:hypothetical protein EDEG_02837 [Edhazardia aedis USNM 41457]|uniref:Uncharacterized protein n=1 Tax=Edhazardia aedis (strain USNM 41457) TaxID=1003232 RepID=J9D4N4_EDHAE|nr:hypothetical protein EDEG_02837 [Edhazardia aedis USNM 41457]|eukprot:EJW02766.1 hypothetical protein EDEG_02837 [Edhazardia aedis USNM 41457]